MDIPSTPCPCTDLLTPSIEGCRVDNVRIELNRHAGQSLIEQIRLSIGSAIREGQLYAGARMPSWRDLAAQLGWRAAPCGRPTSA